MSWRQPWNHLRRLLTAGSALPAFTDSPMSNLRGQAACLERRSARTLTGRSRTGGARKQWRLPMDCY
eukprot:5724381-Pyramimonas_sp.AAC.1